MTTVEDFIKAVKEMRDFQKLFFQNRVNATLVRAKACEARVDKMIAAGILPAADLFNQTKDVSHNDQEKAN